MRRRKKTIEEMYEIAGKYNSIKELKEADFMVYESMRRRISLHEFYDEEKPSDVVRNYGKPFPPDYRPKPNIKNFLLHFHWQTAFPSAAEIAEHEA